MTDNDLPLVSVVFVTFNRPHTLVATYETFLATTDYPRDRLELVVTDDGSDPHVQDFIRRLEFDVYCMSGVNQGLGANINKGLRACAGDYLLLLQDDWLCMRRPSYLRTAVDALRANDDIGLILLHDWGDSATFEVRRIGDSSMRVLAVRTPDGLDKKRTYTDNPHLKRRDFHDVVGWYVEGTPMTVMENEMTEAVGRQTQFKSAIVDDVNPFVHIGDRYSFNPGRRRAWIEQFISAAPAGNAALAALRGLRRAWRQWRGREGM